MGEIGGNPGSRGNGGGGHLEAGGDVIGEVLVLHVEQPRLPEVDQVDLRGMGQPKSPVSSHRSNGIFGFNAGDL